MTSPTGYYGGLPGMQGALATPSLPQPSWYTGNDWNSWSQSALPYTSGNLDIAGLTSAGFRVAPGTQRAWSGLSQDQRLQALLNSRAADVTPGSQYGQDPDYGMIATAAALAATAGLAGGAFAGGAAGGGGVGVGALQPITTGASYLPGGTAGYLGASGGLSAFPSLGAGLGAGSVPAAGAGVEGIGAGLAGNGTVAGSLTAGADTLGAAAGGSGLGASMAGIGLPGWLTIGSLAAGALQGNKDQTTTTTNAPPAYIAPYLSQAAQGAADQYGQGAYVSPLQQSAVGYAGGVLNGDYLNSNPYLDATFNRAAGAVTNQVQSNFGLSGRNVRGPDAAATAQYGAAGAGGGYDDLANLIYGGNYQAERNRQQQVLPMANDLGKIGNPTTALDDYIARLRNLGGGYGSNTSSTPTQSNLYSGLAGLGLALIPGG